MISALTKLARLALMASLIGGGSWISLASVAALTDLPAAAGAKQLLERVVSKTAGTAVTGLVDGARSGLAGLTGGGGEGSKDRGVIVKVADGDTVTVRLAGGDRVSVRFVGIDAPESSTLRRGHAECGGKEAKTLMKQLAARYPRVTLVGDPTQDESDKYDRRLAYVVPTGGGESLQEHMLEAGLADVYVYKKSAPPQRTGKFRASASRARAGGRGVHRLCGGSFTKPVS